jgi:hypothetical protein
MMPRRAGEELGRKPFLFVNECFLVPVVNKSNRDFLEASVSSRDWTR